MRECEFAKARVRMCEGEGARERESEDAMAEREVATAKVQRCEEAILPSHSQLRTLAHATSHFRLSLLYS